MSLPPEIVAVLKVRGGVGKNGYLSGLIREYVYERDRYRCVNCKLQFRPLVKTATGRSRGHTKTWKGRKNYLTIDHIRPRREGGTNDPENLRSLCAQCHQFLNKHERLPDLGERPWANLN